VNANNQPNWFALVAPLIINTFQAKSKKYINNLTFNFWQHDNYVTNWHHTEDEYLVVYSLKRGEGAERKSTGHLTNRYCSIIL